MKQFYQNLAKGMPKDEALHHAKLSYINQSKDFAAHPAFWSPFVQMGDRRSIEVEQKGFHWVWYLLIGIGAVSVLGLFYRMKP